MPSPFPGMNPFLEQDDAWHDFHERFLPLVAERLGAQVMPDYIVKIDEHVYIHELPPGPRQFVGRADLAVGPSPAMDQARPALGVLEAPTRVWIPDVDVERVAYVEIRDRHRRELVTVIELLSPSNMRPGRDREQYLGKRGKVFSSAAHFVEIDLLRGGEPMPATDRPGCAYSVLVSRSEQRPQAGFWPIGLGDRLPVIPVPLRRPDEGARLDLQDALDRVYDAAGYRYYVYEGRPDPPLTPEEAAWAGQYVPQA